MAYATPVELPPPNSAAYDHDEARGPVMDAHGHVQITLEDPVDFVPPPRTGNDDTVERPRYGPLKSPQKRLMQESYPAEDTTPRRRSARLAQTSTPVRPLNLRITVPQVEEAVEETDMGHDVAEINQDAEDGESQQFVFISK